MLCCPFFYCLVLCFHICIIDLHLTWMMATRLRSWATLWPRHQGKTFGRLGKKPSHSIFLFHLHLKRKHVSVRLNFNKNHPQFEGAEEYGNPPKKHFRVAIQRLGPVELHESPELQLQLQPLRCFLRFLSKHLPPTHQLRSIQDVFSFVDRRCRYVAHLHFAPAARWELMSCCLATLSACWTGMGRVEQLNIARVKAECNIQIHLTYYNI